MLFSEVIAFMALSFTKVHHPRSRTINTKDKHEKFNSAKNKNKINKR
jgi:hypothetical protein